MSHPAGIRLSRLARDDLVDIWVYVAASNPRAADSVLDRIHDVFLLLAENPLAGRERTEVGPQLRSFPILSWLIFYRLEADDVVIARVLHGARDLDDADY